MQGDKYMTKEERRRAVEVIKVENKKCKNQNH